MSKWDDFFHVWSDTWHLLVILFILSEQRWVKKSSIGSQFWVKAILSNLVIVIWAIEHSCVVHIIWIIVIYFLVFTWTWSQLFCIRFVFIKHIEPKLFRLLLRLRWIEIWGCITWWLDKFLGYSRNIWQIISNSGHIRSHYCRAWLWST